MNIELSFIIVKYKGDVSKLAEQIHTFVKQSHEIIVSNNSEPIFLKNAKVLNNRKNLGYGKACNVAISQAKGKFIVILNPDIRLNKDTISDLLTFMKNNPDAKIVAPKLLNDDGSLQFSCRKFPTLRVMFVRNIPFMKKLFYKSLEKHNMSYYDRTTPKQVDWVSGAFMMFREKYFFDPTFFMYFEDVELCKRIGNVWYCPTATAHHTAGHGSKRNAKLFYEHVKSMLYYFLKTYIKKRQYKTGGIL